MTSWEDLTRELDAWQASGRVATFWWRDDDCVEPTAELDKLIHHASTIPIALAVIPALTSAQLADKLREEPSVTVLQHGWRHINHAGDGSNQWSEYPASRDYREVAEEFVEGRRLLSDLFGIQYLPVFVPPFYGFDDRFLPILAKSGITAISVGGPRRAAAVDRVRYVNVHCVPILWTTPPSFGTDSEHLDSVINHLRGRRLGQYDPLEPTGLATHHLVQDDRSYEFISQLAAMISGHPGAAWLDPKEIFTDRRLPGAEVCRPGIREMPRSPMQSRRSGQAAQERTLLPIDSLYFLLHPGWRKAVRYDPWYYAQRWAREVPVVLVQPELPPGGPATSEPEQRLENVEILSIEEQTYPACLPSGIVQSRQIVEFMGKRGHCRPLLWLYNPSLMFAYALVPAVSRIYFGNENYLELTDVPDFVDLARAALAISDKIICGSEAMCDRVRVETGRSDIAFIPNGCEYERYSKAIPVQGAWTELLRPILASGTPIAVFAGGINNWRLDFAFLDRLAQSLAQLHFVYAGPVEFLKDEDREAWADLLRRPNVSYLGFLDADDLPWLYRFADRGFMPYRPIPLIRKNPIPLKSLEMAAAGLPVVSMPMESLSAIREAVEVAEDETDFIEKLGRISRRTRSPEAAARVDALCRQYDYDRLFERALAVLREGDLEAPPRPAPLAPIYDILGAERALRDLRPLPAAEVAANRAPESLSDLSLAQRLLRRIPPELAAHVPEAVRNEIKRLILPAPRELAWQRRLLWHIPPAAGSILPNSVKSALRRSLHLS